MQQRKKYSEEFKREAVGLTRLPGANVSRLPETCGSVPINCIDGDESWMGVARRPFPVQVRPGTRSFWHSSLSWPG